MQYLIAGYAAALAIVAVVIVSLMQRFHAVEREIEALRSDAEKAG